MPISRGDGRDDSDRCLFREGAYPDGDPHLTDQSRPQYGVYPATLGAGPRGSDRRIPGPGRVDLERHEYAINREPLPVLHTDDHGSVLPLEDRLRGLQRDTIARGGQRRCPPKKYRLCRVGRPEESCEDSHTGHNVEAHTGRAFRRHLHPSLTPPTEPHSWEQATESVAALASHTRATDLSYDHGAPLPDAQSLQGLRVEGACNRQPFALLIMTERRTRLQTKPPIQRARRKARSL
jgi:hypothetical protein